MYILAVKSFALSASSDMVATERKEYPVTPVCLVDEQICCTAEEICIRDRGKAIESFIVTEHRQFSTIVGTTGMPP